MNLDSIAERNWIFAEGGQRASGLVNDRVLTRKVVKIDPNELAELAEYLRQHTSVLNAGPEKCFTVLGPMVDGIKYEGLWRGVSVETTNDFQTKCTITQQLSLGWATQIAWKEARLLKGDNLQPLGAASYKFLTVQWVNCARGSVNAMAASLSAASFSTVVIQGEPYAGTWYNSGVTPSIAPDGSGIVTLELSIQYRDIPFHVTEVAGDTKSEVRQQLGLTTETQEPIVQATGIVKTQQVSVNKDSSKNVQTNKQTAIPISIPEYIAHIGDRTTVYHSEEKHAAAVPNIMTYKDSTGTTKTATLDANGNPLDADGKSVELSILSHSLDDFLTRNYTKSRTVKKFPISDADNVNGISWPVYGDMETVTIQDKYNGVPYVKEVHKYQIVDTYTMRYFTSAKAAREWIISKNTLSVMADDPLATGFSGGHKTKYDENHLSTFHGGGTEWMAIAVVRTRSLRYTYRYDPPS